LRAAPLDVEIQDLRADLIKLCPTNPLREALPAMAEVDDARRIPYFPLS
jgi:hypothetical protein